MEPLLIGSKTAWMETLFSYYFFVYFPSPCLFVLLPRLSELHFPILLLDLFLIFAIIFCVAEISFLFLEFFFRKSPDSVSVFPLLSSEGSRIVF